jgi:hypothetical protein
MFIVTGSLVRRDASLECKVCATIATNAGKTLAAEATDMEISYAFDDACIALNSEEHVDCRSFLTAYEADLLPEFERLRNDKACVVIEVCAVEDLPGATEW